MEEAGELVVANAGEATVIERCDMCRVQTRTVGRDPLWELVVVGDRYRAVCPSCLLDIMHYSEAHKEIVGLADDTGLSYVRHWASTRKVAVERRLMYFRSFWLQHALALDVVQAAELFVKENPE